MSKRSNRSNTPASTPAAANIPGPSAAAELDRPAGDQVQEGAAAETEENGDSPPETPAGEQEGAGACNQTGEVPSTNPATARQHSEQPAELPPPEPVTVNVPRGTLEPDAYLPRKIEARLSIDQRKGLKMLTLGLRQQHTQLASGKHVDTHADAIRWLLEQIAE